MGNEASTAAVEGYTGTLTVYRKHRTRAYWPLGDSLDDFVA